MFPILLVMMAVTGAFYPAIDLGAGEKERGTMETLLISPATRPEIVLGKFFTVALFSLCTALLNLVSMGITSKYLLTMGRGRSDQPVGGRRIVSAGDVDPVGRLAGDPAGGAVQRAEPRTGDVRQEQQGGQYYLTPLLMVTMGLAMFCISPSVEINPYYSVFPVVGPGLLLKALLLGQPLPHLAPMYWPY